MLDGYSTWKPTYTLPPLMVGDHHSVKWQFGIWFKPDLWAFVNFLYFIDPSKPEAFSRNKKTKLQAYDNTYYMLKTSQDAFGISTCLCIPSDTSSPSLMPSCTPE